MGGKHSHRVMGRGPAECIPQGLRAEPSNAVCVCARACVCVRRRPHRWVPAFLLHKLAFGTCTYMAMSLDMLLASLFEKSLYKEVGRMSVLQTNLLNNLEITCVLKIMNKEMFGLFILDML